MHRPRGNLTLKRIQARSAKARRMAAARWDQDRARRDEIARLEAADPLRAPGRIVRRIIVITAETTVKEAVIRDTDTVAGARRKLRDVLRAD